MDDLISRIHDLAVSGVYLQAFADPTGTGLAAATYFPNRVLPMRADLFNRVAWQLHVRAHVKVFAWMPVLSFDLGDRVQSVMAWDPQTGTAAPAPKAYRRASPFDPRARELIGEIYEDMARQSAFTGILFHDDAMLSDFEDASPLALSAYRAAGLPASIQALRADPATMNKWTAFKTKALIDFTHELTARVQTYRAPLTTVRNIYAAPVLNPGSEEWFAQSYKDFLGAYDYTAIEAMPDLENVPDADKDEWMRTLISSAKATAPNALQRTVFELQSVDWRKAERGEKRDIPTQVLADQMKMLMLHGAMNFGYCPDDFKTNTPDAATIHKAMSLQGYMYTP